MSLCCPHERSEVRGKIRICKSNKEVQTSNAAMLHVHAVTKLEPAPTRFWRNAPLAVREKRRTMPFSLENAAVMAPNVCKDKKANDPKSACKRKFELDKMIVVDSKRPPNGPTEQPAVRGPPSEKRNVFSACDIEEIQVCIYKICSDAVDYWPKRAEAGDRLWQIQFDTKGGKNNAVLKFREKFNRFLSDLPGDAQFKNMTLDDLDGQCKMRLVETHAADPDCAGFVRA